MNRRALVLGTAACGASGLTACAPAPVQRFPSWAEARNAVAALALPGSRWRSNAGWSLSQTLQHLAQSIDGSMAGYPEPKSRLFVATVGAAAHAVFDARGRMAHALDEPIPGAPALQAGLPLDTAVLRLLRAMDSFEAHAGPLAPHFAYGTLDKRAYARAHQMHLANHWDRFEEARDA